MRCIAKFFLIISVFLVGCGGGGANSKALHELFDACEPTVRQIESAIKKGADVNAHDQNDFSVLAKALSGCKKEEVISALLKAGADVKDKVVIKTNKGALKYSILMWAAEKNQTPEIITALLKAGADANVQEEVFGATALMLAAATTESPEVIKAFWVGGADVNLRSPKTGSTPLMLAAAANKNPKIITALLNAGAKARVTDKLGNTALDYAKKNRAILDTPAYDKLKEAMTK